MANSNPPLEYTILMQELTDVWPSAEFTLTGKKKRTLKVRLNTPDGMIPAVIRLVAFGIHIHIENPATACSFELTGDMDGDLLLMSPAAGDCIRSGNGTGDCIRDGDGEGNAIHRANGEGSAFRLGAGEGHALQLSLFGGNASRSGKGYGHAVNFGFNSLSVRTDEGKGAKTALASNDDGSLFFLDTTGGPELSYIPDSEFENALNEMRAESEKPVLTLIKGGKDED